MSVPGDQARVSVLVEVLNLAAVAGLRRPGW